MSAFEVKGKAAPAPVKPIGCLQGPIEIQVSVTQLYGAGISCNFCKRSGKQLDNAVHYLDAMVPSSTGIGRVMFTHNACETCIDKLFEGIAKYYARKEKT